MLDQLPQNFDLTFDNCHTFWRCDMTWQDGNVRRVGFVEAGLKISNLDRRQLSVQWARAAWAPRGDDWLHVDTRVRPASVCSRPVAIAVAIRHWLGSNTAKVNSNSLAWKFHVRGLLQAAQSYNIRLVRRLCCSVN